MPAWHGLQASAQYGFGEAADGNAVGSSFSAAVKYSTSPAEFALGYLKLKMAQMVPAGATTPRPASASRPSTRAMPRRTASNSSPPARATPWASGWWAPMPATCNTRRAARSAFRDTAIFNTAGLISSYQLTPQWFLSAGYSDTFASRANGVSTRTLPPAVVRAELCAVEAYRHLPDRGAPAGARPDPGPGRRHRQCRRLGRRFANGTPSSNGGQTVVMVGLKHSF